MPLATAAGKVHPLTREMLPDDPLCLHAAQVPGDPGLMLRMLVEEYARIGFGRGELVAMARDPFYQALHGLWRLLGEEELGRRIEGVLARTGVARVRQVEAGPVQQIALPASS